MRKSKPIYLDYASSVLPNPSSIHEQGVVARKSLEKARSIVANLLEARPKEIIFTSGGTESNNLAIQGLVFAWRKNNQAKNQDQNKENKEKRLPHLITTNIEHSSVLETFKLLAERGLAEVTFVPVEPNGIVDPKKIKKEIKKNTILVSVMYANNEIGTIQPIKEIAKEIRHWNKENTGRQNFPRSSDLRVPIPARPSENFPSRVFFHTDAVQAVNYLDLNVEKLGVDLLTLSGTKIEEAGRVGVLYKRTSATLENIYGGGDQESGLRPGTENLLDIIKFSKALAAAQKIKEKESARVSKLRDYFIEKLGIKNEKFIFNGDIKNTLPNIINITIPKIPSDLLVIELSAKGIMASSKSACKAGDGKASYVIEALRGKMNEVDGSLRFSLGRRTSKKDIDYTLGALAQILTKLKKWYTR